MAIEELTAIVTPPNQPTAVPHDPDWSAIERALGIQLPQDYKHFVVAFGSGLLGNFIRVFNPFDEEDEYMELVSCVRRVCGDRRAQRDRLGDEEVAFPIYPEQPGILAWGNDENGNELYWFTEGPHDEWKCVLGEGRGLLWEQFNYPMTTFLAKALMGTIESNIWPDDFPDASNKDQFETF